MSDQGVTDVTVPTVDLLPHGQHVRPSAHRRARCSAASAARPSSPASTAWRSPASPPSRRTRWSRSARAARRVPATADLAFAVTVQNQGDVAETDVAVKVDARAARRSGTQADRDHRHHRRRQDAERRASRASPSRRTALSRVLHAQGQGRAGGRRSG